MSLTSLPRAVALPLAAAAALALLTAAPSRAQCVEDCTVLHTFEGEASGDQLGWVSNDIGDIDGDGIRDLVLTAPTNDAGGNNAGRIYVHSGATGAELWTETGTLVGGWLGHDAAPAGDIDDDGVPDLIVGVPFSGAGRARLLSGVDGSLIHEFVGANNGDQFGFRVWGGGDFNGDGTPDVVIGAPMHDTAGSNAGRAYVFSGATFGPLCQADGPTSGDQFGSGVAFIGDVSLPADGTHEILVGAQNAGNGSGRAYVYSFNGLGCSFAYQAIPPAPAMNFGLWFMNGGGDVDGDGIPDFYVNDFAVNRAHVFSGLDGQRIWSLSGDGNGGFGIGRLVDDVDGDGRADLFLAAWISPAGAPLGGKAFVYSGRDAQVLETFTHDVNGAGFGFDANGMGDVDGDGKFDYLVTAALDNANNGRGVAFVVAGTVAPVDFNGDHVVDVDDLVTVILNWGPCTATPCIGDTNRDGQINVDDLIMVILNWS